MEVETVGDGAIVAERRELATNARGATFIVSGNIRRLKKHQPKLSADLIQFAYHIHHVDHK